MKTTKLPPADKATNHIVSFSTGLSSALVVERVIKRYGPKNTHIVFMDTQVEDDDNYRFMDDCQARWGKEIIKLADGRTPRQVAQDKQIIPNQKIAPCTFELKIEVFSKLLMRHYGKGVFIDFRGLKILFSRHPVTIHIGYDIFEAHRCEATRRNYEDAGWAVDFPLLWKPIEHRSYSQVVRDDWEIEPPRTYAMGFSHANCLKMLCFKAGISDAIRFLINFPDRYREQEEWEQRMRNHPVRRNYSILRDQTGGKVKPLTLRDLRLRYEKETDKQPMLFDFDQQSPACVSCGLGDLI
jgi:hypothetical protein